MSIKIRKLRLDQEEWDDLCSAVGIAIRVSKKIHKDSPKFRAALNRLNKKLWDLR